MRSSWTEPYLWVHLAGVAAVPIFLELCLVGLAASQTVVPVGIGFLLVAIVGISPIFWMQWYRPFSIFSLVALALKPSELTEMQRQILRCFKAPVAKFVAVVVAILGFLILWQLNQWLPPAPIFKVPGGWFGGLLLAAVAFLLSNLFLQVPASVLTVLLTPERQIAAATPYPVAQIPADFTLIGLQVKQILPPLVPASVAPAPVASTTSPISTPLETPQPEISQPEITEPKSTQLETPQLEITEPPIPQPEFIAEADGHELGSEPMQAELITSMVEVASEPPAPPAPPALVANAASDQQVPQVTDTVVSIKLPLGTTSTSLDSTQHGLSEPPKAEPNPPVSPTVTDTIVTIGLPFNAAPPSEE
jgi:hypothetical protein